MARHPLASVAFALLVGGALPALAGEATGTSSGACDPASPEPQVEAIGDAVARASAHPDPAAALAALQDQQTLAMNNAQAKRDVPPCVPPADARREVNEQAELAKIEKNVKAAAEQQCKDTVCLSNLAHFATGYNVNPWTFGGCENWARLAADTIGNTNYFDMRREQRCHLVVRCHWVVVLTNLRTNDVHVVDLWAYKGGWAPGSTKSWYVSSDYDAFKKKFGEVADTDTFQKSRCNKPEAPR